MALVNNSENKSISTCTVQRGLMGLGQSSWIALRKPLASETYWRKGFQHAREHKDSALER